MKKLSRRNFIRNTAAGALGAATAAVLTSCGSSASSAASSTAASGVSVFKPGTYTASATGMDKVTVSLTFSENAITDVSVDVSNETATIGALHGDELAQQLMNAQSAEIDGVAGATVTSDAVKKAAQDCINQAMGVENTVSAAETTAENPSWLGDAPEIPDSEIVDTIETDIVVIGGGNAGAMCAFAAAEEGATVSVIESQAKDSIFYYGLHDIASINSEFCLSHGVEKIRNSEFIAEFQRRSHNRTNPRLVKKFVDNSGEMMDWLIANVPEDVRDKAYIHNLDTNVDYFNSGAEVNKFKCWRGSVQLDFNSAASTLVEHAEEQGAIWYWEHTGVVLVTETKNITVQQETADETGAVTMADVEIPQTTVSGVIAKDKDGKYHKFLGKKGVVLACGGYGGNHEMYVALQDEQRELYKSHGLDTSDLKCSGFGRDGSGIKMGMWAGASMDPCARTLVSPQVRYNSEHYATNILRWGGSFTEGENPWGCPFVWLDESGRRFTDETFLGVFGQLMRAERMKPGRYYAIFDSQYADLISKMPPEHFGMPVGHSDSFDFDGVFKSWLDRGAEGAEVQEGETVCAWAANTLEELFQYMGLTETQQAAFKAEIEKYNTYCANGDDEDFGRDPKMLLSVTKPPFYGMYSAEEKPMVGTVTLNGLVIDENQKVLDANYNPIVGLYATGNNSGGRFAVQYSTPMPGLTLGMAMTLGRVLGKELAEA